MKNQDKTGNKETMKNLANKINYEMVTDSKGKLKVLLDFQEYKELLKQAGLEKRLQKPFFDSWYGLGLQAPVNPNPPFKTDDDIWAES